MRNITRQFAEFAAETTAVPASARNAAFRCLLDLMGCAAAGYSTEGASAVRRGATISWGTGESAVWFSGKQLTPPGAAFANAAMACQLDLDDGHRAAAGHPGAAVIPAALATAGAPTSRADDILAAICLGYEIAIRIASSRDLRTIPTTDSGPWCGTGAAVAAACMRRMPANQLAHALAICGTTAPGQWATSYTRHMGNHVKEGIPMATAGAILALDLAAEGFTGPVDIYDAEDRYERARLLEGLGESWLIESVYFKPYSACRWAHAPVDALLALMSENALFAEDIETINVATFNRALTLNNAAAPASLEAAQYSIPFCLGLAATGGVEALLPMREASLRRADAQQLATKVKLSVDPKLDAMFSDAVPARVTVGARGTQFSKTILAPKGEPSVPMTNGDLEAKAMTLCGHAGNFGLGQQLIEAAKQFRDGDRDGLMKLLSSPALERRETALAAAQ